MSATPMGDVLPDDPLDWLLMRLREVVWAENPRDQVAANLILIIIAVVATFVSLGATIFFVFIFGFFLTVGLVRLTIALGQGEL